MEIADDTASMDMSDGMSEVAMGDGWLEKEMEPLGHVILEDEIPVEMEVNGEMCLFSWAAIAELHLLRENAHL
jgi:hypothetical protein